MNTFQDVLLLLIEHQDQLALSELCLSSDRLLALMVEYEIHLVYKFWNFFIIICLCVAVYVLLVGLLKLTLTLWTDQYY